MLVYVLICWAMYTVKGFHIVLSSSTFYGLCRQDSDVISAHSWPFEGFFERLAVRSC